MIQKSSLYELGLKHGTDKVLHHRYDRIYPTFLENFREKQIKFFEIGCGAEYSSFKMWAEYFSEGKIFCMDINEELQTSRGIVYKGDQTQVEDLQKMVDLIGPCEIIIDDGSHVPKHQIETFEFLFDKMLKNGGVYIIEDIECNYWNSENSIYGYKIGHENLIEYFQSLPNQINSEFSGLKNNRVVSSVTYFKNCIIITKMNSEEVEENNREYRFKEML